MVGLINGAFNFGRGVSENEPLKYIDQTSLLAKEALEPKAQEVANHLSDLIQSKTTIEQLTTNLDYNAQTEAKMMASAMFAQSTGVPQNDLPEAVRGQAYIEAAKITNAIQNNNYNISNPFDMGTPIMAETIEKILNEQNLSVKTMNQSVETSQETSSKWQDYISTRSVNNEIVR